MTTASTSADPKFFREINRIRAVRGKEIAVADGTERKAAYGRMIADLVRLYLKPAFDGLADREGRLDFHRRCDGCLLWVAPAVESFVANKGDRIAVRELMVAEIEHWRAEALTEIDTPAPIAGHLMETCQPQATEQPSYELPQATEPSEGRLEQRGRKLPVVGDWTKLRLEFTSPERIRVYYERQDYGVYSYADLCDPKGHNLFVDSRSSPVKPARAWEALKDLAFASAEGFNYSSYFQPGQRNEKKRFGIRSLNSALCACFKEDNSPITSTPITSAPGGTKHLFQVGQAHGFTLPRREISYDAVRLDSIAHCQSRGYRQARPKRVSE